MYKIITKTINKNKFSSELFPKKEIKKIIKADIIEDTEEYFVINMINNQVTQKSDPSLKDNAKIIPK